MILQSDSGIWQVAWSGGSSIKPRMNGSQNTAWIPIKRTYQVCLLALNFLSTRSNLATINRRPLRFVPTYIPKQLIPKVFWLRGDVARARANYIARFVEISIFHYMRFPYSKWRLILFYHMIRWLALSSSTNQRVIQESKQGALIPPPSLRSWENSRTSSIPATAIRTHLGTFEFLVLNPKYLKNWTAHFKIYLRHDTVWSKLISQ